MALSLEAQPNQCLEKLDLSRYGLENKDLERKCPAMVRLAVAELLGDWKMLGYYLEFSSQTLNDIEVENRTEERRRIALLEAWDKREGKRATYLKLVEALHRRKRTDLVEYLCENIKSGGTESFQAGDHQEGRNGDDESDHGGGGVDALLGQGLGEQGDDSAPGSTGLDVSVSQRVQSLEDKMNKLNKQLRSELEKKVSADDLLDELTLLPIVLRREYQDSVKKAILMFGDTCSSVRHVFRLIINQLTTFLDCKLLEHLISIFGSSQLKMDMAGYVENLNNFKKETNVAELMEHWDGIEEESMNFVELQVRFGEDPTECNLEKLDEHRRRFCSQYKLSELVMILVRLKPGSFIATWKIPTALTHNMESTIKNDDLSYEMNILTISVAGSQIFPQSSKLLKESSENGGAEDAQDESNTENDELPEMAGRLAVEKYEDSYSLADSGVWSSASMYSGLSSLSQSLISLRSLEQDKDKGKKYQSFRPSIALSMWRQGEKNSTIHGIFSRNNAVATINNLFYFNFNYKVIVYNPARSTKCWSILPDCPYAHCSLVVINNVLTAIGGGIVKTNKLFSYNQKSAGTSWTEKYPPMPTKRGSTTAVSTQTSLIVAGGVGEVNVPLKTIEVMNTETHQWSTAADLPHPMACSTSSILCKQNLVIVNNSKVYNCEITALLETCTSPKQQASTTILWSQAANIPVVDATCVSFDDQLLAIGGKDHRYGKLHTTAAVHIYDPITNSWNILSYMSNARSSCIAAVSSDNQLIVIGGSFTDTVEIVRLSK